MNLQTRIRQIVQEHSGGIKLIELATLLTAESFKSNQRMFDLDNIRVCIDEDPTLDILEYSWVMAPMASTDSPDRRMKWFVHQI